MASISKIVTPDGETAYDIKDLYRGCEFIYGTQTATTGAWTGVSKDTELVDGKQILYFLPFAGSGNATLNLTLADGTTTGAKNVYFQSTTRMTTHYGQYSQFRMIYHKAHKIGNTTYEGWWSEPGRDTTTTNATQMQLSGNALVAASALTKYNIIVANSSGKYVHLKSNTPFDITYPIVYLSADCAANAATNNVYSEINFTVTTTQSITLTAQKPVFVKGTLSGKMFTPINTTPLTQTIPTSADGYHYLYLGYGYAATAIRLQPYHPVFAFIDGKFGPCVATAISAENVNGHTVAADVPADAKFTDHTYSGTGLISVNSSGVISTTAEANQNAFSNVKVGSTTVAADSKTDTLELVAGSNITLTPDATNDKVTISSTDHTYSGTGLISVNSSGVISTSATANTGTVTKVSTGAGLTGGDITSSGTIKADIKNETKSSLTAQVMGSMTGRQYAVGLDYNGDLSVNIPWPDPPIANKISSTALSNTSIPNNTFTRVGDQYTIFDFDTYDVNYAARFLLIGYVSFSSAAAGKFMEVTFNCESGLSMIKPTTRGVSMDAGGGAWCFALADFAISTRDKQFWVETRQQSGSAKTTTNSYILAIKIS